MVQEFLTVPAYLLDTNAIGDIMSNHPKTQAKVALHQTQLGTSVVVRGESYYGVEKLPPGKRRSDLKSKLDAIFAKTSCEPVTDTVANRYAVIRRATEIKGFSLDDNDLWIAATALELGAVLVTRDKDFAHVPGLQVEDWTQ